MKKKYSDEEPESAEPTITAYEGTGDFIQMGEEGIELTPGDKIADIGPAFVFYVGPNGKPSKAGAARPFVDTEEFEKFKAMDRTREDRAGIWLYE